jgi:hypothetical protein
LGHGESQVFTHSSDLPVEPLFEDDSELEFADSLYFARICHCVENWDSLRHSLNEMFIGRLIDRDNVFLFVVVFGSEDFVDNITFACQKYEAFTVFIQSSNWKNPLWMPNKINDIGFFTFGICGADDADRFVKSNISVILDWFAYFFSIYCYLIERAYFGSELWSFSIDGDSTLFKELICCSSGAKTHFTQVFIDPNERVLVHVKV